MFIQRVITIYFCSSGTPVGAKMQSVHYFEGYDRVANFEVQKHGWPPFCDGVHF